MLKKICEYMAKNDKHGHIMDVYNEEYLTGNIHIDTMKEICRNVLGMWQEDIEIAGEMHGEVLGYYEYLGLKERTEKPYTVYADGGIVFETKAYHKDHAKVKFREVYGYNYLRINSVKEGK